MFVRNHFEVCNYTKNFYYYFQNKRNYNNNKVGKKKPWLFLLIENLIL